jgi:hypothetical protein
MPSIVTVQPFWKSWPRTTTAVPPAATGGREDARDRRLELEFERVQRASFDATAIDHDHV